jgi:hypothetical protein
MDQQSTTRSMEALLGQKSEQYVAERKLNDRLTAALRFIRDLAAEELPHTTVGTGAEIALRHIVRRVTETLK